MVNKDRTQQLISENGLLRAQVEELIAILKEREELIGQIGGENIRSTELRSKVDMQLADLHHLQNIIGVMEQSAEGAANREREILEDLDSALEIRERYAALYREHIQLQSNYDAVLEEADEWRKSVLSMETRLVVMGELESRLDEMARQRDGLQARISELESQSS